MSQPLDFPLAVPELFAQDIRLRELTEDDIPAWFARATDTESADLAGDPVPASIEMGHAWLQRHREQFRQNAALRWAIVPEGLATSVGTVGIAVTSAQERTAELGIVVGRAHWGRGFGTSAARLAIRFAFDTLGLAEIRAEVLQRNLASLRLLEKAGFHRLRAVPDAPPSQADADPLLVYACVRSAASISAIAKA